MSFRFASRRPGLRAGGLILVLWLSGCADGRKALVHVQGQVLDADGNPAFGARVIFHPLEDKAPEAVRPIGTTDETGTFTLTTYNKGDGAPAGSYAVTLDWPPPRATPTSPKLPDQLKGRFATIDKSPFKATIGNQDTTLEPFRLN